MENHSGNKILRTPKIGTFEPAAVRDHRVAGMDHGYPPHPGTFTGDPKPPEQPL